MAGNIGVQQNFMTYTCTTCLDMDGLQNYTRMITLYFNYYKYHCDRHLNAHKN